MTSAAVTLNSRCFGINKALSHFSFMIYFNRVGYRVSMYNGVMPRTAALIIQSSLQCLSLDLPFIQMHKTKKIQPMIQNRKHNLLSSFSFYRFSHEILGHLTEINQFEVMCLFCWI